ncbi:MAG: Sec-independent protein translocase protein TatB [Chloroflexota bacterium]|nr:Sec-independent protein translocase protein TatB [Chloroflexota bacterium]
MNFFGIGLPEIVLILVLALIVLGPQRLPEFAAQLARLVRQARRYAGQVTSQLKYELGDLAQDYEALREELRQLREELREQSKPLEEELRAVGSELKASSESIQAAASGKLEKPQEAAQPPSEGKG